MEVKHVYQIYELLDNLDIKEERKIICRNIKNFRTQRYNNYKKQYKGVQSYHNPYSTENISSYLGISKVHYKRLER